MTVPHSESAEDLMKDHLKKRSVHRAHKPIAYSADVTPVVHEDPPTKVTHKKVSIIGCGQVGMAIAFAILNQETAGTIALVDMNGEKLEGEAKDLRQGSAFHKKVRILASTGYDITNDSHLVIVTAGVAQKVGESRLSLLERNVKIMKSIIPQVLEHSPEAPICIVSNPCDIMTAVASKIAGPSIPPGRIFGSGTCLDSSRLRSLIAKTLEIDGKSVHGYIVGEHGDSSVAAWSSVRVGGLPFIPEGEEPSGAHIAMHNEVVNSAADVILRKGYTNWSVGLTAAFIANIVLNDTRSVVPLSTCVRGLKGIENDVFLSLPCLLGYSGVRTIVDLPLTKTEEAGFIKSAEKVWEVQKNCWDTV